MMKLIIELQSMFPFIARMPGIEKRSVINVFSSQMITLQEKARFILSEADDDEKMLQWIQGRYPYATISDAKHERLLIEKLLEAKTDADGHKAVNELNNYHKSMASRDIKRSAR